MPRHTVIYVTRIYYKFLRTVCVCCQEEHAEGNNRRVHWKEK